MDIINFILQEFSNKKGGINTKKIKMKSNTIYFNHLLELTNFLPKTTHLRYRFNYIKFGYANKPKLCKNCGGILIKVENNFCSSICSNKNEEQILKMKTTWSGKTNNDILKIQIKRKITNLEKYGVDIASKHEDTIIKNKNTHFKNWGDYAMKNINVSKKREVTCINKYGGLGMASKLIFDKIKETNIKKYDIEYYSMSYDWYQKCVKTCVSKYGEEWVSKVDYINVKQQSGGYLYHDFEFPSGKICRVQGYEPRVLTKLLSEYNEEDIIVGVQNIINEVGFFIYELDGIKHRYYPDIYIKPEKLVIEVKSNYTFNKEKEKNLLKRQSVLNKNIKFKFIIL